VNTVRFMMAAVLALAVGAPAARAQIVIEEHGGGAGTVYSKSDWPTQSLPRQPLTLATGQLELGVPFRIDISTSRSADVPSWSVPAYLDLGLTDFLQLGAFHGNAPGQGPIAPVPGVGLCFAGTAHGCRKTYDDIGARVRVGLVRVGGQGQLALEARAQALGFGGSGETLDTRVSGSLYLGSAALVYKQTLIDKLAFLLDADWTSRLNKRNDVPFADQIAANVGAQLELLPGLAAYGQIGVAAPVNKNSTVSSVRSDTRGPVVVGAELTPLKPIGVGAEVRFPNLVGQNPTADDRDLAVYARLFL
jgi:opacity protein-like surface antigen